MGIVPGWAFGPTLAAALARIAEGGAPGWRESAWGY
jgi:hypothetical protein